MNKFERCYNCIHRAPCGAKGGLTQDGAICNHFKDKSLFVELPCKVGDTIWCKDEYCDESYEIVERVITSFTLFKNTIQFYAGKPSNLGWVRSYDITDFGKTVFLTKEEAERKLREVGE